MPTVKAKVILSLGGMLRVFVVSQSIIYSSYLDVVIQLVNYFTIMFPPSAAIGTMVRINVPYKGVFEK